MAFRVGQKVVCVDDDLRKEYLLPRRNYTNHLDGLKKGNIYTVAAIGFDVDHNIPTIAVVEIVRRSIAGGGDFYWAGRFRPVVERKTDTGMVILRKLLTDTKIKEKV